MIIPILPGNTGSRRLNMTRLRHNLLWRAEKNLEEIKHYEQNIKPKKEWLDLIQKMKNPAKILIPIFYEILDEKKSAFDPIEKLGLLIKMEEDAKIEINPQTLVMSFDFFYNQSKLTLCRLYNPQELYKDHIKDRAERYHQIAGHIRDIFESTGRFSDSDLASLNKTVCLWQNFEKRVKKRKNTERVAFGRLLWTTLSHPREALSYQEIESGILQKIKTELDKEKKLEEIYLQETKAQEKNAKKSRYEDRIITKGSREKSRFKTALRSEWNNWLAYKPLPETVLQALADYKESLQDLNAESLTLEKVLSSKRVKTYQLVLRWAHARQNQNA